MPHVMTQRIIVRVSLLAGLTALASIILYCRLTSSKSEKKTKELSLDEVQHYDTSPTLLDVDVIDISYTSDDIESSDYLKKCEGVAEALRENGYVIVRDSRVSITDNDDFLDMMERSAYFIDTILVRYIVKLITLILPIDTMPNLMGSETPVQNIIIKSVSHHLE